MSINIQRNALTGSVKFDCNYLVVRGNDRKAFRSGAGQEHVWASLHKDILVAVARHGPRTSAEVPQEQQRKSSNHRGVTRRISFSLEGTLSLCA